MVFFILVVVSFHIMLHSVSAINIAFEETMVFSILVVVSFHTFCIMF